MKKLLLAVIPSVQSMDSLLNNLSEAEFPPEDISIRLTDEHQQKALADDAGPLKGTRVPALVQRLTTLGLSQATAHVYTQAVAHQHVLLAMLLPEESILAAKEILGGYSAEEITVV